MSYQRYTDDQARSRMTQGCCPECGYVDDLHTGWGGPAGCSITDFGVASRIYQYREDLAASPTPAEGETP